MLHRTISITIIIISLHLPLLAQPLSKPSAANLQALAKEFSAWRAVTQPATYNDVNRVERPDGWTPDVSAAALEDYAAWIKQQKPAMGANFAIGTKNYDWYVRNIALIPFTREEMLLLARQEWDRSVAFHHYENLCNANLPVPPLFKNRDGTNRRVQAPGAGDSRFHDQDRHSRRAGVDGALRQSQNA